MKNLLLGIFLSITAISAMAQKSDWKITTAIGKNDTVAGYIYHTEALGLQQGTGKDKDAKFITGLRLACQGPLYRADDPSIFIFWDKMTGNNVEILNIVIDNKPPVSIAFDHDNAIVFKPFSETASLIKSIKTGKSITISWTDPIDNISRVTIFDLRDFNTHLQEFNKLCGTEL